MGLGTSSNLEKKIHAVTLMRSLLQAPLQAFLRHVCSHFCGHSPQSRSSRAGCTAILVQIRVYGLAGASAEWHDDANPLYDIVQIGMFNARVRTQGACGRNHASRDNRLVRFGMHMGKGNESWQNDYPKTSYHETLIRYFPKMGSLQNSRSRFALETSPWCGAGIWDSE